METSLLDAVINFIGTNSPKGISEAIGTIGKWGATEADYIAFLQSKGFTVLQGANGQYTVYKVGECIAGNGNAAAVSTVFETTATEVTVEAAEVTEVAATGTGAGIMGLEVGVAGAAIAPALGVLAGVALYNLTPDFWDGIAATLTGAGKLKDGKVPTLIDEDGKTKFDQGTIDIYKNAFLDAGLFDIEPPTIIIPDGHESEYDLTAGLHSPFYYSDNGIMNFATYRPDYGHLGYKYRVTLSSNYKPYGFILNSNTSGSWCFFAYSKSTDPAPTITRTTETYNYDDGTYLGTDSATAGNSLTITIGATTYQCKWTYYYAMNYPYSDSSCGINDTTAEWYDLGGTCEKLLKNIIIGIENGASHKGESDTQDGATLPTTDPINITFPDWVPQIINNVNWYPVSMPTPQNTQAPSQTGDNDEDEQQNTITDIIFNPSPLPTPDPIIDPDPQPEPEPEPQPEPTPQPDPVNPNPEPDPSGDSPIIPPVSTTSVSSLFTVYNPTDTQLNSLGAFLWTTSIIEQIKKIWQNPIEGVISLHKVYSGVVTGSSKNIILGYVDSGVSALEVTSQFATVDCGSITVAENKHNATDYSPFTQLQLYLPFIGIQELDTNEIMNGRLHVVYKVDVYTGTCIALVYAQRSPDMQNEQLLYTFSGNASQKLPLTASDFGGAISALLGIVGVGVASGGALGVAAGALGVAHSLTSDMVHIQHSGGLSANSGILAPRKPFLIISRQYGYDANGYAGLYGYPANKTVYLSNCTGFTRVKNVIFKSAATDEEKRMIEAQLKEGIIL